MTCETDASSKPSALLAWLLAARPRTLPAAATPVVVALALAHRDFADGVVEGGMRLVPAVCCLLFALLSQIAANFINDYADFVKGADGADRKGPRRAVASGWISPRAMFVGALVALALACAAGLFVVPYGGAKLIAVGAICCVFCLLYSVGPFPLAYFGLGDALVLVFFGVVAVAFTHYVQTGAFTLDAALAGLAIGFATDNILTANNYRDRDEDRANKKYTLIAVLGEPFGRYLYLFNGLASIALFAFVFSRRNAWNAVAVAALVLYFVLHLRAWRVLARLRSGAALASILAASAKNLLVLGVMVAVAFCAR